jgi:hypothetical protein
MNIQKLASESLEFLKFKYDIPQKGFIAGGCLANLVWEKVSGNVARINDIDVYIFDKQISPDDRSIKGKQNYTIKEIYNYDDYRGINYSYRTKEFYSIDKVERDGMINTIYYDSSKPCPETILKSFDINCCQLGYDIESDKFYWTSEFEDFIKSGKLKVINLGSPAHTAIRLVKKRDELKSNFDPIELDMIEYCIEMKRFLDSSKLKFKDRYAEIYQKYKSELSDRFEIERDLGTESWLLNSINVSDRIWKLSRKSTSSIFDNDLNVTSINRSVDFIYYVRNIFGNKNLEKIWCDIHHLFNKNGALDNYLDQSISNVDLQLLQNVCHSAPRSINNLRGLKISHQLSIIKGLLKRYSEDPLIALTILENHSVEEIQNQDEFGMLLLELSHRKDILSDSRGKVTKLFEGIDKESII